jgi:hypothetical protein
MFLLFADPALLASLRRAGWMPAGMGGGRGHRCHPGCGLSRGAEKLDRLARWLVPELA